MLVKAIYLDSLDTRAPTPGPAPPGPPARSVRPRSSTVLLRTFFRPSPSVESPLAVCLLHYLPRRAPSLQKTAGAATGGSPALASAIALRKPASTPILLFAVSASQRSWSHTLGFHVFCGFWLHLGRKLALFSQGLGGFVRCPFYFGSGILVSVLQSLQLHGVRYRVSHEVLCVRSLFFGWYLDGSF